MLKMIFSPYVLHWNVTFRFLSLPLGYHDLCSPPKGMTGLGGIEDILPIAITFEQISLFTCLSTFLIDDYYIVNTPPCSPRTQAHSFPWIQCYPPTGWLQCPQWRVYPHCSFPEPELPQFPMSASFTPSLDVSIPRCQTWSPGSTLCVKSLHTWNHHLLIS